MAQVITNSGHDDMIHDAVLDYYGRRLATCSSDRTIKIFEIEGETHRLSETLRSHEGAIWSISWAHPKFGTILASASYTGHVHIHRENRPGQWERIHDVNLHAASVNTLAWAPHEAGCLLACASSDGNVSVLEFLDNQQMVDKVFPAHPVVGVNSVSWAPATAPGSLVSATPTPGVQRRFVTGGSDNLVKLWSYDPASQSYKQEGAPLQGHNDWVRDVAWSPSVLQKSYIASASQDKTVRIWTSDAAHPGQWESKEIKFDAVVWRVSWSLSGNVLAVSSGDNKVSLWKENVKGEWENVKTIEE